MIENPEAALRLADWLSSVSPGNLMAAAELRRQHEAIKALEAELAEWRKLRDPAVLHVNLLRGMPAKLTPAQVWHLVADDRDRLAELEAERDALRADAERYRFIRDADASDNLIPELLIYAMESLDEYVDKAMRAARNAQLPEV